MQKNENTIDRLIRVFLSETFFLAGFFWLAGGWQILAYILAAVMLITALTGFCLLYKFVGINKTGQQNKPTNKFVLAVLTALIVFLAPVGGYYSNFFTKKFFLEDFGKANNYYKQTLFFTGQNKRAEAVDNYNKLTKEFTDFQAKYSKYHPYAISGDKNFDSDLEKVSRIIAGQKDAVLDGDLPTSHKDLETIRPIFQDILKRNKFSPLSVALVEFHDSMEVMLDFADKGDTKGIIDSYTDSDSKLKAVETELNDESIKLIRKNLDELLELAKTGQVDKMSKKGGELKSNYVKVYLKKG